MLDKMKDLYQMQKEMKSVKAKMKTIHIEAEEHGLVVVINASLEIISVNISSACYDKGADYIAKAFEKAMNKAVLKAQKVSADDMKKMMGMMGMGSAGH